MKGNVAIEAVSQVPFGTVLAWGGAIIGIIAAVVSGCIVVYKVMEKYRKSRNQYEDKNTDLQLVKDKIGELKKENDHQTEEITGLAFACQQILALSIDDKIIRYYNLGYIPKEEFSQFQKCFSAYERVHGNGELKEKYEKVIHELRCK